MAAKEPRAKQVAGSYGLADIRVLAKMLSQYDLTEVEVEHGSQRVRLRRERAVQPAVLTAPVTPVVEAPRPTPEVPQDDGAAVITSPFIGTFYQAPGPEVEPFVKVGQEIKKGQVLCIIEAMKLMNEIESDIDCKILQVVAKNAEPVEFGQTLFKVSPLD